MEKGWNREQHKWQQFLGEIGSLSWRFVALETKRNAVVPSRMGVYVMVASISEIARLDGGKAPWNKICGPFYIGKASNLNQRFLQHASGSQKHQRPSTDIQTSGVLVGRM